MVITRAAVATLSVSTTPITTVSTPKANRNIHDLDGDSAIARCWAWLLSLRNAHQR